MVFFPKPGLLKEWGSELAGSILFFFVVATTVANSGGSLAFAVNAPIVAIAHAGAFLFIMAMLPYIHINPLRTLNMIANDVICWVRGSEGPIYILRYLMTFLLQILGAIIAALLTWIYLPSGGPIHLGLTRVPAGVSDGSAFWGLAVSATAVNLVWLVVSENVTPLYKYGMGQLREAARLKALKKPKVTEEGDARKNILPDKGQIHLFMASIFRAFVMFGVILGVTALTQPIAGYTTNPAFYLGYAIVSWQWDSEWPILIFAPFVGWFFSYALYLPYTFASTVGPFTKYYGRRMGRNTGKTQFGKVFGGFETL